MVRVILLVNSLYRNIIFMLSLLCYLLPPWHFVLKVVHHSPTTPSSAVSCWLLTFYSLFFRRPVTWNRASSSRLKLCIKKSSPALMRGSSALLMVRRATGTQTQTHFAFWAFQPTSSYAKWLKCVKHTQPLLFLSSHVKVNIIIL